jgi:hypothetical protein
LSGTSNRVAHATSVVSTGSEGAGPTARVGIVATVRDDEEIAFNEAK